MMPLAGIKLDGHIVVCATLRAAMPLTPSVIIA